MAVVVVVPPPLINAVEVPSGVIVSPKPHDAPTEPSVPQTHSHAYLAN